MRGGGSGGGTPHLAQRMPAKQQGPPARHQQPPNVSNDTLRHLATPLRTWNCGGMITGVGEELIRVGGSCRIEPIALGLGEGARPSTWKPTTVCRGAR